MGSNVKTSAPGKLLVHWDEGVVREVLLPGEEITMLTNQGGTAVTYIQETVDTEICENHLYNVVN